MQVLLLFMQSFYNIYSSLFIQYLKGMDYSCNKCFIVVYYS